MLEIIRDRFVLLFRARVRNEQNRALCLYQAHKGSKIASRSSKLCERLIVQKIMKSDNEIKRFKS